VSNFIHPVTLGTQHICYGSVTITDAILNVIIRKGLIQCLRILRPLTDFDEISVIKALNLNTFHFL
jgi:hypothetical protein